VLDDDIRIQPEGIDELFRLRAQHDLTILAPALDGGRITFKDMKRRPGAAGLRGTPYVEMNVPLFKTSFLYDWLTSSFDASIKGWGTDIMYSSRCARTPGCKIWIADGVTAANPDRRNDGSREISKFQNDHERRDTWLVYAKAHRYPATLKELQNEMAKLHVDTAAASAPPMAAVTRKQLDPEEKDEDFKMAPSARTDEAAWQYLAAGNEAPPTFEVPPGAPQARGQGCF
jgi:hypothetical protein